MKIAALFGKGKTVLSFEVFPPKSSVGLEELYPTLERLRDLSPDYISVTYGAGGGGANNSTCRIATIIKERHRIEPLAHLTCVNSTKSEIQTVLDELRRNGIENILALRGDKKEGATPKDDFRYASELAAFIREAGGFHLAGACYPEGHADTPDIAQDILNLKGKVDAGAGHLISQLFFDNRFFYGFVEKARLAGIRVPIQAGIMPVVNKKQVEKMVSLCGASIPEKLAKSLQRYENNPEALRDAGVAYAVDQIADLVSHRVEGIHLYTMNNPYLAKRIRESVSGLL